MGKDCRKKSTQTQLLTRLTCWLRPFMSREFGFSLPLTHWALLAALQFYNQRIRKKGGYLLCSISFCREKVWGLCKKQSASSTSNWESPPTKTACKGTAKPLPADRFGVAQEWLCLACAVVLETEWCCTEYSRTCCPFSIMNCCSLSWEVGMRGMKARRACLSPSKGFYVQAEVGLMFCRGRVSC